MFSLLLTRYWFTWVMLAFCMRCFILNTHAASLRSRFCFVKGIQENLNRLIIKSFFISKVKVSDVLKLDKFVKVKVFREEKGQIQKLSILKVFKLNCLESRKCNFDYINTAVFCFCSLNIFKAFPCGFVQVLQVKVCHF